MTFSAMVAELNERGQIERARLIKVRAKTRESARLTLQAKGYRVIKLEKVI